MGPVRWHLHGVMRDTSVWMRADLSAIQRHVREGCDSSARMLARRSGGEGLTRLGWSAGLHLGYWHPEEVQHAWVPSTQD